MIRKIIIITFIALSIIPISNKISLAITVIAHPNPARVNQNITATTTASSASPGDCTIEINYGDSAQWFTAGTCSVTGPPATCTFPTNHIYTEPGIYSIVARSQAANCLLPPFPPDPSQAFNITVNCASLSFIPPYILPSGTVGQGYIYQLQTSGGQAPITFFSQPSDPLPPGLSLSSTGLISGTPTTAGNYSFGVKATDSCSTGVQSIGQIFTLAITEAPVPCPPLNITNTSLPSSTVGQAYSAQIQSTGGQAPITFSLVSGIMPAGLSLSSTGLITGAPTTAGNYSFTVRAADSCSQGIQTADQNFNLIIQIPTESLSVSVVPPFFYIPRGQSSALSVMYNFTGSPSLNVTLQSLDGKFLVDQEIIGVNPPTLTANIQNGTGKIGEVVSVPVGVINRAIERNSNTILYVRTFVGSGITLNAVVNIFITTEAGADFAIKRIALYFENRRPEITVERNYPNLKAYADIRFVGSGLLQGFWEVDGRILSYVNQHLTFGKNVVIESPQIPPLPTYDTGTHSMRFVVTKPITDDIGKQPFIFYFVNSAEYAQLADIPLISPTNKSQKDFMSITFEWEKIDKATFSFIQYFDDIDEKPFFAAYTKEAFYILPEAVLKKMFSPGKRYFWYVTGYNEENNIIAKSKIWDFSFKELSNY